MAQAKAKVVSVQLDLNLQEAETLLQVLNHIGGAVSNSPRALMDNIRTALLQIHIEPSGHAFDPHNKSLYFEEYN